MADLEERLKALVAGVVVPTLKPRGYAKRTLSWQRKTEDAVHAVSLQRSHGNAPDHLRFYVEISAFLPEFDRRLGRDVPADLAKATPQFVERFERIAEWPAHWVDLESWTDAELHPAFEAALIRVDASLSGITEPEDLVAALRAKDLGLDLTLFAWWCATGDAAGQADQLARATATFGHGERWPRLFAQFERVAAGYGVTLPS